MSRFATVVFVALVGATFSAFFVAQELKSRPPVVKVQLESKYVSPNGDGRKDTNRFFILLKKRDQVTVSLLDANGDFVRRLLDNANVRAGRRKVVTWNGRDAEGRRVADGEYRLRVSLRRQGRSLVLENKPITVDTKSPRPVVLVDPERRLVSARGVPVDVRVRLKNFSREAPARFSVWRTDVVPARKVASFSATEEKVRTGEWDGTTGGPPAPPGTYLIEAIAQDRAGNAGSSAPGLPRRPPEARGRPGVTVRALAAQPPLEPEVAGRAVSVLVDARRRAFVWRLRRLGQGRPVKRGEVRRGRPRVVVTAPGKTSGAYLLELRAGRYRTAAPVLVQSPRRSKLLVVAPLISWLGSARLDDDADGFPDTLDESAAVRLSRPFADARGLPENFADQFAPLLVHLDRSRVRYDLTTDLALAQRQADLDDYDGILIAGPARWVTRRLARDLRGFVTSGGRVASIGVDALRRGVDVTDDALQRPTQPTERDIFGARLVDVRSTEQGDTAAVALGPIAEQRELGLLEGSDGVLTGFTAWEEARMPNESQELLTALGRPLTESEATEAEAQGREPRQALPIVSATRIGRGVVIRVGLPEWGNRLTDDEEVRQIQRNIVDILRRVEPRVR
ncbi:MAG: hypothetical protein M3P40_07445 [Actinomycetota bacterium]|nr:hypothetical protein [Actinomycetota bacterium]